MPADWGFANAALNEPESTSSAPDAVAVAPRSASSNDLVDRAPSRQGGRSKPHENVLGSDVSVGRIRPKSGNRSKNVSAPTCVEKETRRRNCFDLNHPFTFPSRGVAHLKALGGLR